MGGKFCQNQSSTTLNLRLYYYKIESNLSFSDPGKKRKKEDKEKKRRRTLNTEFCFLSSF